MYLAKSRDSHRRSAFLVPLWLMTSLGLIALTGCASSGPVAPKLQASVVSDPAGLTVLLRGESVGVAPLDLALLGLDEAASLTVEDSAVDKVIERRIKVLGPSRVHVVLTLRDEPSDLAKALGLENILVFDYGDRASFEVDSFELASSLEPLLRNQAEVLGSRFANLDLLVCGHTDSSGDDDHNGVLSIRRAQAVAEVLVENGIDEGRLKVQGFAADYPLAPNSTRQGRALNRRTEIVIGE